MPRHVRAESAAQLVPSALRTPRRGAGLPPRTRPAIAPNGLCSPRWAVPGAALTGRWRARAQTFESYYSGVVVPRLRAASGTRLIPEFVRAWDDHCLLNKWMYRFFMYLVRSASARSPVPVSVTDFRPRPRRPRLAGPALCQAPQRTHAARAGYGARIADPGAGPASRFPLRALGMSHFHDIVFKKFAHELSQRINEEVQRARKGEVVDFDLLRRCIHVRARSSRPYPR